MDIPQKPARDAKKMAGWPHHFYLLDALRGVAALAIVVFHWQHFKIGLGSGGVDHGHNPFPDIFAHVYQNGWMAVDLFFCLSGFIFYWLYADMVAAGRMKAKEFFVLRFSRIYPLYLATLILVLVEQLFYHHQFGRNFLDEKLTFGGFISQLFLLGPWRNEYSYNLPSWSIAVEMFLYLVFFGLGVMRLRRWWQLLAFVALSLLIQNNVNSLIGGGLCSFFIGGLAYYLLVKMAAVGTPKRPALLIVLALFILGSWHLDGTLILYNLYQNAFGNHVFLGGKDLVGGLILAASNNLFPFVIFPLGLVLLGLLELQSFRLRRPGKFLGDISYSAYMLHFPLQILFVLGAGAFGFASGFFDTRVSFLLFFIVLVPLSWASHNYFERPLQSLLRRKLLGPEKVLGDH